MLLSLNKKRNQSKNAIKEMINYTLQNIFNNLNEEEKIKLLKTIIEISEGRIYVEVKFLYFLLKNSIFFSLNTPKQLKTLLKFTLIEMIKRQLPK